jgi:probable phosphoglycerate mutase
VIADLREVYLGEWEGGHFRAKVAENDPIALQVYAERRWDVIPGAEPHAEFTGRVRRGIETIATAHPDQLVVAVVHGGVIGAAVEIATGGSGFAFGGADNASLTHLVVTADRWILRCFNDSAHLHDTFRTVGLADGLARGIGAP